MEKKAKLGAIGQIYPRTCLETPPPKKCNTAIRLALPNEDRCFYDRLRGKVCYNLPSDIGDPVLKRRNGDFAYALAVTVDDAQQGVTDIVRGVDLLATTPIQCVIQDYLGYRTPRYLHLPLALDANGRKLSKQNHAKPVHASNASHLLVDVLTFLGQNPPEMLKQVPPADILHWAVNHWSVALIPTVNIKLLT